MISAVDTNILLDLLIPGAPDATASVEKLDVAHQAGAVILSGPVYAEIAANFPDRASFDRFIGDTGLRLVPLNGDALYRAGQGWIAYNRRRGSGGGLVCPRCGHQQSARCEQCSAEIRPRQHIVADFLIGAHALIHADRLLTRDRGYYRTYFPELALA